MSLPGTFSVVTSVPPLALSFVAQAAFRSGQIAIPGAAAAGDLALLAEFLGSPTTPSGWTPGCVSSIYTHGKVLTIGDLGTSVGAGTSLKQILIFRPNRPITSLISSAWTDQTTSGNPALQTVLAAGQLAPLIVHATAGVDGSLISWTTETPALDTSYDYQSTERLKVGYKLYNASPADHSIDTGDNGSNNALATGYWRVA